MRLTVVLASGLMWLSCVLRLCSLHPPAVTPLTHVSAFINGLGGPVGLVLGPVVAALWFPLQERVTGLSHSVFFFLFFFFFFFKKKFSFLNFAFLNFAFASSPSNIATAVSGMANYIGVALSFVVGPALVPNRPGTLLPTDIEALRQHVGLPQSLHAQCKIMPLNLFSLIFPFPSSPIVQQVHVGASWLCIICVFGRGRLLSQPPHERSHAVRGGRQTGFLQGGCLTSSAGTSRLFFFFQEKGLCCRISFQGLRQLAGNGNFWLISAAQLTVGIFSAWSGYLLPNMRHFRPADRVESEAGWLGFYSTLAGCFAAVLMSLVADRLRGHLKFMLLVSLPQEVLVLGTLNN